MMMTTTHHHLLRRAGVGGATASWPVPKASSSSRRRRRREDFFVRGGGALPDDDDDDDAKTIIIIFFFFFFFVERGSRRGSLQTDVRAERGETHRVRDLSKADRRFFGEQQRRTSHGGREEKLREKASKEMTVIDEEERKRRGTLCSLFFENGALCISFLFVFANTFTLHFVSAGVADARFCNRNHRSRLCLCDRVCSRAANVHLPPTRIRTLGSFFPLVYLSYGFLASERSGM